MKISRKQSTFSFFHENKYNKSLSIQTDSTEKMCKYILHSAQISHMHFTKICVFLLKQYHITRRLLLKIAKPTVHDWNKTIQLQHVNVDVDSLFQN